jgi:hypothetical protein
MKALDIDSVSHDRRTLVGDSPAIAGYIPVGLIGGDYQIRRAVGPLFEEQQGSVSPILALKF